jgi:hypothetical protein
VCLLDGRACGSLQIEKGLAQRLNPVKPAPFQASLAPSANAGELVALFAELSGSGRIEP